MGSEPSEGQECRFNRCAARSKLACLRVRGWMPAHAEFARILCSGCEQQPILTFLLRKGELPLAAVVVLRVPCALSLSAATTGSSRAMCAQETIIMRTACGLL